MQEYLLNRKMSYCPCQGVESRGNLLVKSSQLFIISLIAFLPLSVVSVGYGSLSSNTIVSSKGSINYSALDATAPHFFGCSSYPKTSSGAYSTGTIDSVISTMNTNDFNIYRMSIYYTQDDTTRDEMVRYFLEHCSYNLIVCRHVYNPGGSYSSSDWVNVKAWTLDLLATFSNYQNRLWVEPINEAGNGDLSTQIQTIVTATRSAGYTANLVFNKWKQSWSSLASVNDPLDKTYFGYHFYFNSWSLSSAKSQMQSAMSLGLKIINTEIGADFNEASQFDQSEVVEVNDFSTWCKSNGISNTVWMRYGLENFSKYKSLGLVNPLTGNTVS